MVLRILKYVGLTLLALITLGVMSSCTMLGLNYASLETDNKPLPVPELVLTDLQDWTRQREALLEEFQEVVYGPWPKDLSVSLISRRVADENFAGGAARLEEFQIRLGVGDAAEDFFLGLAVPKGAAPGSLGVVIGQTFSDNCGVFQSLALRQVSGAPCDGTDIPWLVEYIFGEYIAEVPFEQYFEAGFAYANYYGSDVVPDRVEAGRAVMDRLKDAGGTAPTGALMAWAYAYKAAIDVLENEAWLDEERIAVYGHSRHGKSALLGGIFDRRIDLVLSHQSGFGGAALSRSTVGEGIGRVTETYPHWFAPGFDARATSPEALPVDQHQLLATLAPTPVFLGNGRRDVWSDPNSTFRAAEAADPVYDLYGVPGLVQSGLIDFAPGGGIAYFLRPGGHGTDKRDIAAIIDFLKAHTASGIGAGQHVASP
ncbi:MAG: hypothetical protein AAFX86_10300 [Pseudomonadota bacterium]